MQSSSLNSCTLTTLTRLDSNIKTMKKELKQWEQEYETLNGSKPTKPQITQNKDIGI